MAVDRTPDDVLRRRLTQSEYENYAVARAARQAEREKLATFAASQEARAVDAEAEVERLREELADRDRTINNLLDQGWEERVDA